MREHERRQLSNQRAELPTVDAKKGLVIMADYCMGHIRKTSKLVCHSINFWVSISLNQVGV